MTSPTLRELASLPSAPAALADSTLLLIDCQHTYRHGVMERDGRPFRRSGAWRIVDSRLAEELS